MYKLGQIVRMRKAHPCGGELWRIIRIGMDFRIKCLKCGRSVLLPRARFERKVKEIVAATEEQE
ncbi:MAG: DUF951 domain-containing protein [Firmicutes bacterium]|jgi:hypothetical protein|nr:DUF951 domain-containing protein [Bacillota bacterium]